MFARISLASDLATTSTEDRVVVSVDRSGSRLAPPSDFHRVTKWQEGETAHIAPRRVDPALDGVPIGREGASERGFVFDEAAPRGAAIRDDDPYADERWRPIAIPGDISREPPVAVDLSD